VSIRKTGGQSVVFLEDVQDAIEARGGDDE
jgi:hypothetical protein